MRPALVIITLHFTCGETKICSTIQNSQNMKNMVIITSTIFAIDAKISAFTESIIACKATESR